MELPKYNKYHDSKIYKIVSPSTKDVFIGATYRSLHDALGECRRNSRKYKSGVNTKHVMYYDIMEYGDCQIVLLENYKCESIKELNKRKRYWIEQHEGYQINKVIPSRQANEYNREHRKLKYDCPCGVTCRRVHKSIHEESNHHRNYINRINHTI
jgi:hypothetical protein